MVFLSVMALATSSLLLRRGRIPSSLLYSSIRTFSTSLTSRLNRPKSKPWSVFAENSYNPSSPLFSRPFSTLQMAPEMLSNLYRFIPPNFYLSSMRGSYIQEDDELVLRLVFKQADLDFGDRKIPLNGLDNRCTSLKPPRKKILFASVEDSKNINSVPRRPFSQFINQNVQQVLVPDESFDKPKKVLVPGEPFDKPKKVLVPGVAKFPDSFEPSDYAKFLVPGAANFLNFFEPFNYAEFVGPSLPRVITLDVRFGWSNGVYCSSYSIKTEPPTDILLYQAQYLTLHALIDTKVPSMPTSHFLWLNPLKLKKHWDLIKVCMNSPCEPNELKSFLKFLQNEYGKHGSHLFEIEDYFGLGLRLYRDLNPNYALFSNIKVGLGTKFEAQVLFEVFRKAHGVRPHLVFRRVGSDIYFTDVSLCLEYNMDDKTYKLINTIHKPYSTGVRPEDKAILEAFLDPIDSFEKVLKLRKHW